MRAELCTALALGALLGAGLAAPRHAHAQEGQPAAQQEGKPEGAPAKSTGSVDQITGRRLNEALEALKAEKYDAARAVLTKLDMGSLSPYELSRVEQLLAAVDQGQEKYASARGHLEKALASGGLNDQEAQSVRYQIAQFYAAEEKWREAIKALNEWFTTAQNPNSAAYYMLAVAYYQVQDFKNALEPAQQAVNKAERPQENWLQLLLALRIEREEFKLAVPILEKLIGLSPRNKNYWVQLSSVHANDGDYQRAVVPMQLAHHMGLLTTESELRRLAELLAQVNIPFRAATIIADGIAKEQFKADAKTLEFLGNCWISAREYKRAVEPLERAAELAATGDIYVRLAEVHVQSESWEAAAKALSRGLAKGQLKNPGSAQLLLGIALYSQEKPDQARAAFEQARQHTASRSQAESWLMQIANDVKQRGAKRS